MITNKEKFTNRKGDTLSDKSAREEYGLTQDEIIAAMNSGELQYRVNYIYENPYYKLLRSEVEKFVKKTYGENYLQKSKLLNELKQLNLELKKLKTQTKVFEYRKIELQTILKSIQD